MKKRYKIIIFICAIIIAVILAAKIFTPYFVKKYVLENSPEWFGRKITFEKMDSNIFSGRYIFYNVKVFEANKQTLFAKFDTINAKLSLLKLLNNELKINDVALSNMNLNIEQNLNKFNFSDIQDFFSTKNKLKTTENHNGKKHDKILVNIDNITFYNGNISYKDNNKNKQYNIPLNLSVPALQFGGENKNIGVSIEFSNGGTLRTQFTSDSSQYFLQVELNNVNLQNATPFVKNALKISNIYGTLNANATASGNIKNALNFSISGQAQLTNVCVIDTKNQTFASLDSLCAEIDEINPTQKLYSLKNAYVGGLQANFIIDSSGNNFNYILPIKKSKKDKNSGIKNPIKLRINKAVVKNFQFIFTDKTLPNEFKFSATEINSSATNFSLDSISNINCTAKIDGNGTLNANWQGNFADKENRNLIISAQNIDMKQFSPYAAMYLGCNINGGQLSIESKNNINKGFFDGYLNLQLINLTTQPQLSMLNAANGSNIKKLEIPISGNVKSKDFKFWKIITNGLLNFLKGK